jgi:hypothetical protein
VEDYAESVTTAGAQATHAVTEVHAVDTLLSLHWTMINSEDYAVALSQRYDDWARLHARSLLGHHKLAAGKISIRF